MIGANHLYLVHSPLQILNAYEVRENTDDGVEHQLIIFMKENQYHNELVHNTLTAIGWEPSLVLAYPKSGLAKLLLWLKLRRVVKCKSAITRVFVGEFSSGMMVAAANLLEEAEFVLLDDGTASLGFPDFRYRGVVDSRYPPRKPIPLLDFHPDLPAQITFFSIYPLQLETPDHLEINRLSFMRRALRFDDAGPVMFVGSNLADNEEISYERYAELMEGVRAYFSENPIIYFPHRSEKIEAKAALFNRLGIEVRYNTLPFELALLRHEPPTALAGFYTTVLDTLRLSGVVPGTRLISFYVDPSEISTQQEGVIARICYDNYRQTPGMRVVVDYV